VKGITCTCTFPASSIILMIIKLENLAIAAPTPSLYAVNKDKASTLPYIPKDHKNGSPRVTPLRSCAKVAGRMPVQVAIWSCARSSPILMASGFMQGYIIVCWWGAEMRCEICFL
jgi:hypothetical protein